MYQVLNCRITTLESTKELQGKSQGWHNHSLGSYHWLKRRQRLEECENQRNLIWRSLSSPERPFGRNTDTQTTGSTDIPDLDRRGSIGGTATRGLIATMSGAGHGPHLER
jgi:hypothetical protein